MCNSKFLFRKRLKGIQIKEMESVNLIKVFEVLGNFKEFFLPD